MRKNDRHGLKPATQIDNEPPASLRSNQRWPSPGLSDQFPRESLTDFTGIRTRVAPDYENSDETDDPPCTNKPPSPRRPFDS